MNSVDNTKLEVLYSLLHGWKVTPRKEKINESSIISTSLF